MSDEIQTARGENQTNAGNLPEGAVSQEEIRIDVYDADVIKDGKISLNFDPYMAQYIVTTDMDLLVVTAEGETITLTNYTDAVNSGILNGIEVPGGGTFEADSVLEIAQTVDDLTAALAEYETATGDGDLTQASGGFSGFSRLEIQSLGGLAASEGEEGPLAVAATRVEDLVSKFAELIERRSIRFTEAEEIAGPVDLSASTPTLILSGSTAGQEDGAIPLDIAAALTDRDGSETLTLTISGLPEGAVLSAGTVNPDGTVTLEAEDLPGLTVTPPSFSSDDFSLSVTATSTERANNATADVTDTIIVQVTGVANAPALTVANSAGIEDTTIGLDIESALSDLDGSESLAIELSGIPDGAVLLSDGVPVTVVDGIAQLTPGQFDNLTITPPANSSEDFQLTVSATATEADGDTATSTSTINVAVASAADAPTLSASDATARYGDAGADVMTGGAGDDILTGAGGSDTISGGDGDDILVGDADNKMPIAAVLDINAALGSDADEVLTITVSGLPAGTALTAGVINSDGSVTLTPEEANGVIITVAPGTPDFDLTVTATSTDTDPDGDSSTVSETTVITVAVDETNIADADYLDGGAGADILLGGSGDDVLLGGTGDDTINTGTAGETGDFVEGGAGDDAIIYTVQDGVGMTQIDGGADFDTLQLNLTGIQFVDPDIQADLRTLQTYLENGETGPIVLNALNLIAENIETVDLRVDGAPVDLDVKADAASLATENASGEENTAIALSLDAALTDTDGSESMSIELSGIPEGAVLKSGDDTIDTTDGTAILTVDQLAGLTITPAADDRSDFSLSVSVTTTETLTGHTETVDGTIDVSITGVANEASLVVSDASGTEDQAIDLSVAVGDIQAGDTASITISGVPDGATLSAGTVNPDGSVTLTTDELAGLTITPAADSSDDFNLIVTVTTTDEESGDTATTTGSIAVSVAADADAPTLTVNDASGTEDQAIALDLSAALTDASEALSVTISDIPEGAVLSAGTVNDDGTVTLTADQLDGLTITPAANDSSDFTLGVTATSTDGDDTATTTGSIAVSVAADADAPTLTVNDASGIEDQAIPLDLSAALTDASEALSVTISDIPEGAVLSAGTVNDDGTVTLTADQFDGLTITPAANDSSDFTLGVTATSTDGDDTATTTGSIAVSVAADADAPTLTVNDASGTEDQAIALDLSAALTDASEALSVTISDIPEGAVLSAGTVNDDGTVTLTADQLDGLTITPAANDSSDFTLGVTATSTDGDDTATTTGSIAVSVAADADAPTLTVNDASGIEDQAIPLDLSAALTDASEALSVTISDIPEGAVLSAGTVNDDGTVTLTADQFDGLTITPAANDSSDFTLGVTATSTDGDDTATTTGSIAVSVAADADAPTLTVNDASGTEDQAIALDLSAALTDASEALSVTISDIPEGAVLSAGTVNDDGTVTLTADQLDGLTITPAANDSSDFTLGVTATSTDGDDTATTTGSIAVSVAADADAPTLTVNDASGIEDQAIPLDLSAALTDASEALSVTISDIPEGAVLSAGTVNDDGSVTLTADQLDGLTITPATNDSSDFTLGVTATSTDGGDTATTTGSIAVSVAADADAPTLTVNDASGIEDQAIPLDLSAALTDASEALSVTISDIPAGAVLSAGTVNDDGTVTLTADQLDGLTITPATNDSSDFTLGVTATSTDGDDTATTTGSIAVSVAADADAPTLTVNDANGTEDQAIPLDLSAALTDASEALSVTISDIPAGAVLSAGTVNDDGTVTLTADQLDGLTITPATNDSSDFTLGVTATSTDGDDTATTTGSIAVSVAADADAPTLTVSVGAPSLHSTVGSATAIAIDSSNATDTGSGFFISTRTLDANGNLNDASTGNISFNNNPPGFGVSGHASGDDTEIGFNNATGVSEQLIVDFTHDTTSVDVAFSWLAPNETAKYELYKDGVKIGEGTYTGITDQVDDAITLTATDGAAFDQIIFQGAGTQGDFLINSIETTIVELGETTVEMPLSISAALTDASETLANISISDLPEGAVLTNTAGDTFTITDGVASLGPDQLAGLTLTVPLLSENFDLQVTAGSIDGGSTATTTSTISINMPDASTPELSVELGEGTVNHVDSGGPLGDIAITNANFEADSLGDGDYNYDISGWVESGSGVAGAWDTTGYSGSYSQEEGAHEGEQAAWLDNAAISQTLNATFEADRLYTLNVDVGDSKMQDNVQYSIKIFAGNHLIGTVTEADFPTVNDAFTTATLTVDGSTFASNFSGFGENLRIELATTGNAQAHFDSVSMTAEAVPGVGPEVSITYPLDITASVAATDADDVLSVSIGNIPDGTTFTNTAGDVLTAVNGALTLTSSQLEGLSITVPNTHETDIDLTVTATATDPSGLTAQSTSVVSIDIDPSSETGVDISGSSGDDVLTGSAGADSLSGGGGDDTIIGGDGSDQISGGSGNDTIYGDRTDGSGHGTKQVTLLDASISSGSGNFSEGFTYSDNVFGTNDSGSASGKYDSNDGADGGGALEVKLGSLSLFDTTSGTSGGWTTSIDVADTTTDTVLTFSYRINMSRSFESDEFTELRVALDGTLHGLNNNDFVTRITGGKNNDFDTGWQTVTLNLGTLTAGTHELILGGFLNKATQNSEDLEINFDNISLVGTTLGNDDTIDGGSGDDVIFADDGDDVIDGGEGTDTIDFSNAKSGVTLDFASGTVTGGSDNDTISNVENAVGSDHADTLTGDNNDNVLQGGGGDDTLDGGAGNDTVSYEDASGGVTVDLANGTVTGADGNDIVSNFENVTGSAHADTIFGDSGDNIINGGGGADALTGGGGADTFKFSLLDGTADTITDFSIADGDKLDVSDLVNVEGNDAISNFVRITEDDSGNSVVQVDTSGSGEDANFEDVAVLEGVTGLDINDVIDTGANNPDAV